MHSVHVVRLLSKSRISVSYLVTYVWFNTSLVVIGKEQSWVSSHEIINSLLAESHLSFTLSDMSQKGELCIGKGTLIKNHSFILQFNHCDFVTHLNIADAEDRVGGRVYKTWELCWIFNFTLKQFSHKPQVNTFLTSAFCNRNKSWRKPPQHLILGEIGRIHKHSTANQSKSLIFSWKA